MVRTQVQLTEHQVKVLKKWAAAKNISLAEMIRLSLDQVIQSQPAPGADERDRRQRAIAAAGKFSSEEGDLSIQHDRYFAEEHA